MIPEFSLRLICGLSLCWCALPRKEITSGFFRIQMLLSLGLSVLLAVTASQIRTLHSAHGAEGVALALGISVAILSFLGSVFWTLERRFGGTVLAGLILFASTAGVIGLSAMGTPAAALPFRLADAISSAALLGTTTGAMLLGHWYLTATGMSLRPLKQYTLMFGAAALLRSAVAAWGLTIDSAPSAHGVLQILRWGGLLGPLVMAVLTIQILKYRNTQSATGVLYAATILVFMGETAAALLRGQALS